MVTATFRFYEELNDFLPIDRRRREFSAVCARRATTKHMIESLGVPHTEVELVLVNGESVGFERILADDDRVAVYPKFESLDITPLLRVRARPLREIRFVADAHLGGLATMLRMAGFDTLYDNRFADDEIVAIAVRDGRMVLTRDRELLKHREITHGCYVHALKSESQLREIFERLDLARSVRPFTLCLQRCNTALREVPRDTVADRVPPRAFAHYTALSDLRYLWTSFLGRLALAADECVAWFAAQAFQPRADPLVLPRNPGGNISLLAAPLSVNIWKQSSAILHLPKRSRG